MRAHRWAGAWSVLSRKRRVRDQWSEIRDPRSAKVPAIEDYQWLLSEVAKPWLALSASGAALTKLALELRKALTVERAHLVLEQIELRERAREKFSLAERMFFTRK